MDYPKIFARVIELCQMTYEDEGISHPINWNIKFLFENEEYNIPQCFYIGKASNKILESHLSLIPKRLEAKELSGIVITCKEIDFYAKLQKKYLLEISQGIPPQPEYYIKEEYIGIAAVSVSWLLGFIIGKMTC